MLSYGGEEHFIYHTSAAQFKKQKIGVSFSLCFDRVLSDKSNEPCPAFVRYRYPIEITPQIFEGYDIMCRDICQTRNGQRAPIVILTSQCLAAFFAVPQHIRSTHRMVQNDGPDLTCYQFVSIRSTGEQMITFCVL